MPFSHKTKSYPERSPWMDVDWQAHQRWVTVDGHRVNVTDMGAGPPIVLVHGLGANWQCWLENVPALAAHHRVIAADLPGFGESEMADHETSVAGYADWLCRVLDELGVDEATIVGNSMGGQIAAEVALRSPQRVTALVLAAAAGISSERLRTRRAVNWLRRADRLLSLWSKQVVRRGGRLSARPRARRRLLAVWFRHPEKVHPALVAEMARGSGKPGFVGALDAAMTHVMSDRLPRIACPTLILWGANDRIIGVRDARAFHDAIPGSRLHIWPDTGHLAMIERADDFNELVAEFATNSASRW